MSGCNRAISAWALQAFGALAVAPYQTLAAVATVL